MGYFEVLSDVLLEFSEMIWLCVVVAGMSLEEKKKYIWVFNCKIN